MTDQDAVDGEVMDAGPTAMTAVMDPLPASPPPVAAVTTMAMIERAVIAGANVDTLEKLMALHERWERAQARKAFDQALSAAKAELPLITKNKTVDFSTSKGRTHYQYEDLASITQAVDPILSKFGLSYRFRTKQEKNFLSVTCILSHRDGCCEETTLSSALDGSGNKNDIQAVGSAATYLQRYTLKLVLGLAAAADDDGQHTSESTAPKQPADFSAAIRRIEATENGKALLAVLQSLGRDALADPGVIDARVDRIRLLVKGAPTLETLDKLMASFKRDWDAVREDADYRAAELRREIDERRKVAAQEELRRQREAAQARSQSDDGYGYSGDQGGANPGPHDDDEIPY